LDARSTKDDQEYLFEPAPQYAFSPNQFRIAAHACARTPFYDSCQASAEHFEQCAEFLPLRNRGLGSLAVTVLPIPLARRAAATACAAVQSTAPLLVARLSPRAAVPMVLFGGNRRVGLTSGLVDLDARGRSPHVRSRRQPTVRPRSRGSLPRLPIYWTDRDCYSTSAVCSPPSSPWALLAVTGSILVLTPLAWEAIAIRRLNVRVLRAGTPQQLLLPFLQGAPRA
jgi:hypothetical protein